VKRRVREIFRLRKAWVLTGYDLVIRAAPASARARYRDLDVAFCKAMGELGLEEMRGKAGHSPPALAEHDGPVVVL